MDVPRPLHEWVVAPYSEDRIAARNAADGGGRFDVDAHRNHRGPYTAAAELVRRVVRCASAPASALVAKHQLTILWVVPELRDTFPVPPELAKSFSVLQEGKLSRWTCRLAHGLTEFVLDYVAQAPFNWCRVSFDNVDLADPLDREFIAILLRRADRKRLLIQVLTASDAIDEPLATALKAHAQVTRARPATARGAIPDTWRDWLKRHAAGWRAEWSALRDLSAHLDPATMPAPSCSLHEFLKDAVVWLPPTSRLALAQEYVDADCTSGRLAPQHAYAQLSAAERRQLHRAHISYLEGLHQQTLALGAIPFHQEQAAGDVEALLAASKQCILMAYHEAALDWAVRGRRMLDPSDRGKTYKELTRNMLFALLLLRRFDEVVALCAQNQQEGDDPALMVHTSYAMAILNARFFEPSRRDYDAARTWVERSLAAAERLPSSPERAVNMAFLRNTMALVELRKGRAEAAEALLSEAIDYLASEVPGRYAMEITLFLHNRARLHAANGRFDQAIDDLTALLRNEPSESDAHYDRGLLYQRLGRYEEALQDFDAAIKWSPPYSEPHFHRAVILVALGRHKQAVAEYDYVLVLDPEHVQALIDRAWLHYEHKRFGAAQGDVELGLRLSPANARMLCIRGLLEQKRGDPDAAYGSFSAAIEADRSLADAWANRATILFRRNDLEAALSDLTQASRLREDAAILYNRGRVLEAQSRWQEAADDYVRALALTCGGAPHIRRHRDTCLRAMGIPGPAGRR